MHLFTRYLLSLAVLFAAVVGGYFFAAFVCYRFTWSENDPLYYLLKVVEQLSPVLIVPVSYTHLTLPTNSRV